MHTVLWPRFLNGRSSCYCQMKVCHKTQECELGQTHSVCLPSDGDGDGANPGEGPRVFVSM